MRKVVVAAAITGAGVLAGCKKTGEGQYQVETPHVDVSTDTHTVQTPSVEVKKETVTTVVPKATVKTRAERKAEGKTP
jgi:hypothetical protein